MHSEEILVIICNFIVTIFAYLIIPIILKYVMDKQFTKKQAMIISIVNSILAYIILSLFSFLVLDNSNVLSMAPATFYFFISYFILVTNSTIEKRKLDKSDYIIIIMFSILAISTGTLLYQNMQYKEEIESYQNKLESLNNQISNLQNSKNSSTKSIDKSSIAEQIINGTYKNK